ncbi:Glutathione S-transferase, unnamed subgroup [hydrothermal vent metagenome]|uniref:Glutathione S-transferase, unnamed subgroup n=1 Tax=hydrothermal vent metagenome TaxID=652676 RepID=A0A3B0W7P5_9ZZZZ
MSTIKLYRYPLSGHSHRVELFLSILGLETEIINVDLANGEHKQDAFLNKNIFGQVPVLEDGPVTIADSNAILVYLASKYDSKRNWLPLGNEESAEVQRFLSIAAGEIAHGPASARLVTVFGAKFDQDTLIKHSHTLLATLEAHLTDREWLAGKTATIADIADYTYIAHAPEGNVSLNDYPNVRAWLKRVEDLPGFVAMQATAVGMAA